jgi:hypothetical protein
VIDQADTLFWVIGLALYTLSSKEEDSPADTDKPKQVSPAGNGSESSSLLQEILSYERVKQALRELLSYLKDLADLTCSPSTNGKPKSTEITVQSNPANS